MKAYLDNNASTMMAPEVIEVIKETLFSFANPSSLHTPGNKARNIIESARVSVARAINSEPDEIIFTSGGTESNNMAIQGILRKFPGSHAITSVIEHPAAANVFTFFESAGYKVSRMPVDASGKIDPDQIRNSLRQDTVIVSIMLANNEVGVIQNLDEIASVVKSFSEDIIIHTDTVQALGKMPVDVKAMKNVDMMSFSSHKIHGPKGIGALYIKQGVDITPLFYGGGHERSLRPGTENTLAIAGFGKAVDLIDFNDFDRILFLKQRLKKGLENNLNNIIFNAELTTTLNNTLSVSFRNVEGEAILVRLDMEGICVSTGSACSSGKSEPSHVLLAMGLDPASAQSTMRFSLSRYTTESEIDYAIEKIVPVIKDLRELSPI